MSNDYLTITIGGTPTQINLALGACALQRCTPYARGGIPEFTFSKVIGKLAALPDPWNGMPVAWSNGATYPGTTYFKGTIVGYTDRYDHDFGWCRDYRALGLRNLGDYVPVTDSNTLSDAAQYNMAANALDSIPAHGQDLRPGRARCAVDAGERRGPGRLRDRQLHLNRYRSHGNRQHDRG